jgi:hypothetical protein
MDKDLELKAWKDAAVELFVLLDQIHREADRTRGDDILFRVRAEAIAARRHQVLNDDNSTIELSSKKQREALSGPQS